MAAGLRIDKMADYASLIRPTASSLLRDSGFAPANALAPRNDVGGWGRRSIATPRMRAPAARRMG